MSRHIAILMFLCIALYASAERVYTDDFKLKGHKVIALASADSCRFYAAETRVKFVGDKSLDAVSKEYFGFSWITANGECIIATINPCNPTAGMSMDTPGLMVTVAAVNDSATTVLVKKQMFAPAIRESSYNSFAVEMMVGEKVYIKLGGTDLNQVAVLPRQYASIKNIDFVADGNIEVATIVADRHIDPVLKLKTSWTMECLREYFKKSDLKPLEGIWKYLDRVTDERYSRLGGYYTIALLADDNGGYDIIYVDGARTNSKRWQCGMRKGRLTPTIFNNNFDLEWYDAEMVDCSDETSAQVEQDVILGLSFPLLKSSLRFSKVPLDK